MAQTICIYINLVQNERSTEHSVKRGAVQKFAGQPKIVNSKQVMPGGVFLAEHAEIDDRERTVDKIAL